MEPILTTEDIVRQLPTEGNLFKEVDANWRSVMEKIEKDPNVLRSAGSKGMLKH